MTEYFIGISDKGKQRDNNEDTFIVQETVDKKFLVACVIDGVGGYNGGEVAAELARTVIMQQLREISEDPMQQLQSAIVEANARIYNERKRNEQNEQMACVLTCAIIQLESNKFYYAHVGDTRLYLWRDRSLVKISRDHSAIGFLEETGRLSEEDAMHHPRRNEINKALGFEEDISSVPDYIETGESPFLPGDAMLLCSDGVSDMINSATMSSILQQETSLAQKVQALVDASNEAGGNDNITAVLVENNKQPRQREIVKPIERKSDTVNSVGTKTTSATEAGTSKKKKNSPRLTGFLSLLSMGLLVALLVSMFQKKALPKQPEMVAVVPPEVKKDLHLLELIDRVSDSGKVYELAQADVLTLAQPIIINKDSFRLNGKGARLVADSNYSGAAFNINAHAKYILIDSLVLENFDVAIIAQKNNVELRNVRFINCRVPVQYNMRSFPDSVLSGRLINSVFITKPNAK